MFMVPRIMHFVPCQCAFPTAPAVVLFSFGPGCMKSDGNLDFLRYCRILWNIVNGLMLLTVPSQPRIDLADTERTRTRTARRGNPVGYLFIRLTALVSHESSLKLDCKLHLNTIIFAD